MRLTALLIILTTGLLVGCAPADDAGDGRIPLAVGGTEVAGSPGSENWQQFQAAVEASPEPVDLRMLIRGQLGSEEQLLSGLRRGRVQIASMSALAASALVPELTVLYAPFLFADEAEADHVLDKHLAEPLEALLAEQGLHVLQWHEIGFHHVYAREPLLEPRDYRNRRFRVSNSIAAQVFAQSLGSDVISMGFADVVPALQTRMIDAGENAVPYYARTGIAEQAPHLMLTGHALGMNLVLANLDWWQSQPPEVRELLTSAFPARDAIRRQVRAANAAELEAADEIGFRVHLPDEATLVRWREVTAPAHELLLQQAGGQSREIYATALAGREAWRSR
ncbi:MAG: TRAP transporter substrate-binding protein [Gammaproteobacteria bacterium]|nr:MAG: TRAP transporter substrate-binding protein [Gammaproteobacteria bacterium]